MTTSQECLPQVAAGDLRAPLPKVRDRRQPLDEQLCPRRGLDVAKQAVLARLDERDGHALASRSAGATDPVDILIGIRRDVVVDDVTHVIDVQATGCDIGRDEDVERPIPEPSHDPIARFLGKAPVEGAGIVAASAQCLGQVVHFAPRSSEDERRGRILDIEDSAQRGELVGSAHHVRGLAHPGDPIAGALFGVDADPCRFSHVAPRHLGDGW